MSRQKAPLVSICVPTYNGAAYLTASLDSIVGQTFADWELIIVDDCSTDSTVEIARSYALKDRRIRIERNATNLGMVGNWNRCVGLAHGDWIKFLFQDDLLAPMCLETMLATGSHEFPLVFCERDFIFDALIDSQTRAFFVSLPTLSQVFGDKFQVDSKVLTAAVLAEPRNIFGEPTAALLHRSLFSRFGYFNPRMIQLCDLEFWIRVGVNTGIAFIPEKLASFRIHPRSASTVNRGSELFRSRLLDRLILLHEFSENRHFAPLRETAAKQIPPRRLSKEVTAMAFRLRESAERAALDPVSPDSKPLEAWRKVAADFPKLDRSIALIPLKIHRMLDRHLLWRFRASEKSRS